MFTPQNRDGGRWCAAPVGEAAGRKPMMSASPRSFVIAIGCALLLAGCDSGLGRSVIVVNRTSETLTIQGSELGPHGGEWNHGFQGCGQAPIEILDADGDEYAQIDAGWCTNEIWAVLGRDEVTLEDEVE